MRTGSSGRGVFSARDLLHVVDDGEGDANGRSTRQPRCSDVHQSSTTILIGALASRPPASTARITCVPGVSVHRASCG